MAAGCFLTGRFCTPEGDISCGTVVCPATCEPEVCPAPPTAEPPMGCTYVTQGCAGTEFSCGGLTCQVTPPAGSCMGACPLPPTGCTYTSMRCAETGNLICGEVTCGVAMDHWVPLVNNAGHIECPSGTTTYDSCTDSSGNSHSPCCWAGAN